MPTPSHQSDHSIRAITVRLFASRGPLHGRPWNQSKPGQRVVTQPSYIALATKGAVDDVSREPIANGRFDRAPGREISQGGIEGGGCDESPVRIERLRRREGKDVAHVRHAAISMD
jgi:hypothetical protein